MNLIPLIGLGLKEPQIVEILDHFKVDVIYDFDRLFENQPDVYWAHLYSEGLLFRFNARQHLDTIFIYLKPTTEFAAHSYEESGIQIFSSLEEAREFAESKGAEFTTSSGKEGIPVWIRIAHPTCFVHYQFGSEGLSMVTIMSLQSAPGAA